MSSRFRPQTVTIQFCAQCRRPVKHCSCGEDDDTGMPFTRLATFCAELEVHSLLLRFPDTSTAQTVTKETLWLSTASATAAIIKT